MAILVLGVFLQWKMEVKILTRENKTQIPFCSRQSK
jgi:hypothetical protein